MASRRTIAHLAYRQQARYGDRPLFHHWQDDRWVTTSWHDAGQWGLAIAAGLWALGCRHGDRVAIIAETRFEWSLIDLAILGFGGVVVGIYPSSTAEQVHYQLEHSESRLVFVEDSAQLAKVMKHRAELPRLETIVSLAPTVGSQDPDDGLAPRLDLDALAALGRERLHREPELPERCRDAVVPEDVATLVYTSGTTGPPKGAVLTHGNLFDIGKITCAVMELGERDVSVVFLPLAHSLQRVAVYAGLHAGASGYYAPSIDHLLDAWQAAQPTIMSSVPRVFEKIHAKIMAGVAEQPRRRQRIVAAALAVGRRRSAYLQRGVPVPRHLLLAYRVVDRVVLSRIRGRIFGHRLRYLISGGAPISRELIEFFHALGVLVMEGWGLTETSAPATLNHPKDFRLGTVGRPLPEVQLRIAADGEVLVRGPGIFREYLGDPQATAEAFDDDGWFRTGDVGELDEDGYLSITDRKKNLIITAGGKNVAPQNIENLLQGDPRLSQVMVHGDRRQYLVALITLDPEQVRLWARAQGLPELDWGELTRHQAVRNMVQQIVAERNRQLAPYESIKDFRLLPQEFSIEQGTMTPSLKLRRRIIERCHGALLAEMYPEGSAH